MPGLVKIDWNTIKARAKKLMIFGLIVLLVADFLPGAAGLDQLIYGDHYDADSGEADTIDDEVADSYYEMGTWDTDNDDDRYWYYDGSANDFRGNCYTSDGMDHIVMIGHGNSGRLGDVTSGTISGLQGRGYLESGSTNYGYLLGSVLLVAGCKSYGLKDEFANEGTFIFMGFDDNEYIAFGIWDFPDDVFDQINNDGNSWYNAWDDAITYHSMCTSAHIWSKSLDGDTDWHCNPDNDHWGGNDNFYPGYGGETGSSYLTYTTGNYDDDGYVFSVWPQLSPDNTDTSVKVIMYATDSGGDWVTYYTEPSYRTLQALTYNNGWNEGYSRWGKDTWWPENAYHDVRVRVLWGMNANDISYIRWEIHGMSE